MVRKRGPIGSLIDEDGNLVYPTITNKKLTERENNNKKAIKNTEKFIESANFTPERINELLKFKQDMEDLEKLEKLENKKTHLKFLNDQQLDIKKYRIENNI